MTILSPHTLLTAWTPLLDAMRQAAWIVDGLSLKVCAANAAAASLLGVPSEQLVGRDAAALIATPEDLAH